MLMVVIPTYNEADNLPNLLKTLFDTRIEDLQVLLVDDNSPDGTGELAEKLGGELYPGKLKVIHRRGKLGFGSASIAGFQQAAILGADYITGMDADLSHDPASLSNFLD